MINHENFKCEDCDGEKFTFYDGVKKRGAYELTLHCATKDCGACYSFGADIKFKSSSHPRKICKCNRGFLDRDTKFCSGCGKENPGYRNGEKNKKTEEN